MGTVICAGCGTTYSESLLKCPYCERKCAWKERKQNTKGILFIVGIVLVLALFVWAVGSGMEEDSSRMEQTARRDCLQSRDCTR